MAVDFDSRRLVRESTCEDVPGGSYRILMVENLCFFDLIFFFLILFEFFVMHFSLFFSFSFLIVSLPPFPLSF